LKEITVFDAHRTTAKNQIKIANHCQPVVYADDPHMHKVQNQPQNNEKKSDAPVKRL
jgi:hypothetical protein